jgi:hypothetical protein
MEMRLYGDLLRQSRRWSSISLVEQASKAKFEYENALRTFKFKKRLKTDFFPNRKGPRRYLKKWSIQGLKQESVTQILFLISKTIAIFVESILVPYILCFSPLNLNYIQYSIQFLEILFFFDVFLKFKSQSFINGLRTNDRGLIAMKYLKNDLFWDLLALFPFNFVVPKAFIEEEYLYISFNQQDLVKFLWVFKMIRLRYLKDLTYSIEDFLVGSFLLEIFQALKFFLKIFIWTHWLACIIFVAYSRGLEHEASLWKSFVGTVEDRYLRNIYLVLETMTSVGYGDMLPKTQVQLIVAIFSMFFACVLFGGIIGTFQNYIENFDSDNRYYDSIIRRLKTLLSKNDFPEFFKARVVKYIHFIQEINQKNDPKNLDILEGLSIPLKEEIFIITRGNLLAKSLIFHFYSGAFLKFLGHKMKTEISAPGDMIFKENETSSKIYFICCGRVQIYHEQSKTVFRDLKHSKYFGEISFFLGKTRTASVMCLVFAEFLTLERSTLFKVLQSRPKENEITNAVLYQIKKYKSLSFIGIRCYLCRKLGHVAKNCTEFVFNIDKNTLIAMAEARKHAGQVNFNDRDRRGIRKQKNVHYLMRFKGINAKGVKFTPGTMYAENKSIVDKAWNLQDDRIQSTLLQSYCSFRESVESEGSAAVEGSGKDFVTFGDKE